MTRSTGNWPGSDISHRLHNVPGLELGQDLNLNLTWEATWVNEFPERNDKGEVADSEHFEGSRDAVLAWTRCA
jgi:hypothetical protein